MSVLSTGDRWIGLAHAKLNLILRVGPRRPDGYHDIISLMVRLQLADELIMRVKRGRGSKLRLKQVASPEVSNLPPLEDNFIFRAFRWLSEQDENLIGNRWLEVLLIKRIPIGAGLGGGSSDLAIFSRFLRHRLRIPDRILREMMLELSTDSIALYSELPGLVTSKGEQVRSLASLKIPQYQSPDDLMRDLRKALSRYWVLLVIPDFQVPTGEAYSWLDEVERELPQVDEVLSDFVEELKRGRLRLQNDFEEPVLDRYPQLRALRDDLLMFSDLVTLAGSGSSLVALLDSLEDLEVVQRMVERKYGYRTLITSFLV